MRHVVVYMLVAVFAQAASVHNRSPVHLPPPPYRFALVFEAGRQTPLPAISEMQQELSRIFDAAGYRFEWHSRSTVRFGDSFPNLAVLQITGKCGSDDAEPLQVNRLLPLGFTFVSDHVILSFSTIDCNRIWNAIEPYIYSLPYVARAQLMGRALARVAGHELYHILVQTPAHGEAGLTKESLSAQELIGPTLRFEPDALRALIQSRKARTVLAEQSATTSSQ